MSLTKKLFVSRKTILDMLESRGVNVSKYSNYSQDELELFYKANTKLTAELNPIDMHFEESNVLVKYALTQKIKTNHLLNLVDEIVSEETMVKEGSTLILITRDSLKSEALIENHFQNLLEKLNIFIQMFDINKLMFNVTRHELVPKHTMIDFDEEKMILEKHSITKDQLPVIKKTDPVAKYLGMKPGQLCKIIRPSETFGMYSSYRICQMV